MKNSKDEKASKEVNKALFQKMGLLRNHLEKIEKEIISIKKIRSKIVQNKDFTDKEKKTKLNELIIKFLGNVGYQTNMLRSHVLPDKFSIQMYLKRKKEDLREEKEEQLKEGVLLGFITAEDADKRRKKWDEKEESAAK